MPSATLTHRLPAARAGVRARGRGSWRVVAVAHCLAALAVLFVVNWAVQAIRKPVELLAPMSPMFAKTPAQTWAAYGEVFRQHATPSISAEFLAALAQVESSGNPIARTYWRWRWTTNPLEIYRPASSAVGMFQITDGRFREAKRYCIVENRVSDNCWFTSLYTRVRPGDSAEMTAAYLDQAIGQSLRRRGGRVATPAQKEGLAAVLHLCGPQRGELFIRQGFRAAPGEWCGDHRLAVYLDRVQRFKREFAGLAARS